MVASFFVCPTRALHYHARVGCKSEKKFLRRNPGFLLAVLTAAFLLPVLSLALLCSSPRRFQQFPLADLADRATLRDRRLQMAVSLRDSSILLLPPGSHRTKAPGQVACPDLTGWITVKSQGWSRWKHQEMPRDAPGVQDQGLPAHTSLQAGINCKKTAAAALLHKTRDKTSLCLYHLSFLPRGVAGMSCSQNPEVALSWRTTKSLGSSSLQFLF